MNGRQLPPLRAARAFEAAARYCSFAQAGKELHLSATAVSQQVKVLEAWLGATLFQRQHNSLVLTEEGRALLPAFKVAFDTLAEAVGDVRNELTVRRVRLAVYPNFAMNWLVPRLAELRRQMPDLELEVLTTTLPLSDLFNHVDIAVRIYEHAPQYDFEYLFSAELFPVAAKGTIPDAAWLASDPASLMRQPLLHLRHCPEDWRIWLQAAGVANARPQAAMWFDSQAVMIGATRRGLGVALARSPFDDELIAQGVLEVLHPLRVPFHDGWYVITPRTLRRGRASAVRDWLLSQRESRAVSSAP